MNFIATRSSRVPLATKSPAVSCPPSPAGDTYYSIAQELLQIADQFELMRTALLHAANMTEQGQPGPLDLAFALVRESARRIQEVSTRAQLSLRDDDLDNCTLAYGG